MIEVVDKPILTHCFEQLADLGTDELYVVVGHKKEAIIKWCGDEFENPIRYAHQREQNGLAHALLTVEEYIDDDFMLMLGDNIFQANLQDVLNRQREHRADAASLVREILWEEASRYGVCDTNDYGEITDVVEKPEDPPSNLVQPSNRGECELSEVIDLLIQSGRTIDAIWMDGWRVDGGYPEDRDKAEQLLQEGAPVGEASGEPEATAE